MEGLVWKYQPGFSQHFFQKYCLLTLSGFQYYKSSAESISLSRKPLLFVPINEIAIIQHVNVSIPEERQAIAQHMRSPSYKPIKTIFPKYQMEVFIKYKGIGLSGQNSMDGRDQLIPQSLNASSPQFLNPSLLQSENGLSEANKISENLFLPSPRSPKYTIGAQYVKYFFSYYRVI